MNFAVLHLSDLHFREGDNPVAQRIAQIAEAAFSVANSTEIILVIVSGDVAFSGRAPEYLQSRLFFDALSACLRKLNPKAEIRFLMVPGNHDCSYSGRSEVRDVVRESIAARINDIGPESELLQSLLEAQSDFFNFECSICESSLPANSNRLCKTVNLSVGSKRIQIHLYNTAFMSSLKEQQGGLCFPVPIARQLIENDPASDFSISVFHHPYNWLESNNAIQFRSHVENTSDLILTGHQHQESTFRKQNRTGQTALCYEAAALQDNATEESGFSTLVFDLDQDQYKSCYFRWSATCYRSEDPCHWQPLVRNDVIRHRFLNNATFVNILEDPGTGFSHLYQHNLRLRDIFVYPNIRIRQLLPKPSTKLLDSSDVLTYFRQNRIALILGSTQAGKTALAKMLYSDLQPETVPLMLHGTDFGSSPTDDSIARLVSRKFEEQYDSNLLSVFKVLVPAKRTVIIDDWHKSKLNPKGRATLLQILRRQFGTIILLADDFYQFQEMTFEKEDKKESLNIEHLSILPLNHVLRGKLIEKWKVLGRELTCGEDLLQREVDEAEKLLKSVVRRSVIKSYPFVTLAVIQAQERQTSATPQYGSYGYIYEMLITSTLAKVSKDITDIDTLYTVIARIAFYLFESGSESISFAEVEQVLLAYEKLYGMQVDSKSLVRDLASQGVLLDFGGRYNFRYQHFYYYFVARYLAENLKCNEKETRVALYEMVERIITADYSHILVIVLYLTKDTALIEYIVAMANRVYGNTLPCDLATDIASINATVADDPTITIPEPDVARNRERHRRLQDEAESETEETIFPVTEYSEQLSPIIKLEFGNRLVDLLGQIVRNFPGSLVAETKLTVVRSVYQLGLRMLNGVLKLITDAITQLRAIIVESLEKQNDEPAAEKDIKEITDGLLGLLARCLVFANVKAISQAVGVEKLASTYATLEVTEKPEVSVRLIDLSLKLDHFGAFPETEVLQLHKALTRNPLVRAVILDLVAQHIMLFPLDYKTRQRVTDKLGIRFTQTILANPEKLIGSSAR